MTLFNSVSKALHPLAQAAHTAKPGAIRAGRKASSVMTHPHANATANVAQIGGAGLAGAAIAHEHQVANKGRSMNKHPR